MSSISSYGQTFNPFFVITVKADFNDDGSQLAPEQVVHFEYDEDTKKADLLKLTILDPNFELLDSGDVDPGNLIQFVFGHGGGNTRTPRNHVIMDLEPDFTPSGEAMFVIYAYDLAMTMAFKYHSKNWGKVKRSDVASQIAALNGLTPHVDSDDTVKKRDIMQPQTMSDMQLLIRLAAEINYACYVEDATLFFVKKGFSKPPQRTFVYRNPDGNNNVGTLKSFKPHMKLSNRPSVTALTDGTAIAEASPDTSKQVLLTNQLYDEINSSTGTDTVVTKIDSGAGKKVSPSPLGDDDKLRDESQGSNDGTNEKNIQGTAELIGDALVSKNMVIYFDGLGKKFSGLWFVDNAKHTIVAGSNYMMSLRVHRQGPLGQPTSQTDTQSPSKVNPAANNPATVDVNNLTGVSNLTPTTVPSLSTEQLN